jgi:hypothetical protein
VDSQDKYVDLFRALGLRLKAMRRKAGYSQEDMLSFGFSTRHWQQGRGWQTSDPHDRPEGV